jgi:hypothetical protein
MLTTALSCLDPEKQHEPTAWSEDLEKLKKSRS